MMAETQQPDSGQKVTRVKLALIAALAVVFVAVLYNQYFAGGETPSADSSSKSGSPAGADGKKQASSEKSPRTDQRKLASDKKRIENKVNAPEPWKRMPLAVALRYDPFALPSAFPQSIAGSTGSGGPMTKEQLEARTQAQLDTASAETQKTLGLLQQRGVKFVIASEDRYYAIVDDKLIEVGDEISGFRVVRISADGVDVEKDMSR
jgi:hypothetical protein